MSVNEILTNLDSWIEVFLSNLGIWGALISCLLITVESILPVLPLCVFVTLVFYAFGSFFGFFISWIFTLLGCFLSFSLIRSGFRKSNMSRKKYMISMMIGKVFMVYFWGYIGTTLIECLTHPEYLLKIVIMIGLAFIISKIVNKYLNLD